MSPNVSREQHLLHAAIIWILVGLMLCVRGVFFILADAHTQQRIAIILPVAIFLGILKGMAMLSKSATRVTGRIQQFPDRTPFWQLYSPGMYLLIVGMVGLGIACRWIGSYWHLVGAVGALYVIVGTALIAGSRTYWLARQ